MKKSITVSIIFILLLLGYFLYDFLDLEHTKQGNWVYFKAHDMFHNDTSDLYNMDIHVAYSNEGTTFYWMQVETDQWKVTAKYRYQSPRLMKFNKWIVDTFLVYEFEEINSVVKFKEELSRGEWTQFNASDNKNVR